MYLGPEGIARGSSSCTVDGTVRILRSFVERKTSLPATSTPCFCVAMAGSLLLATTTGDSVKFLSSRQRKFPAHFVG